jgi:hypothetical protein
MDKLSDEEIAYYTEHGMPIEKLLEISNVRVFGLLEGKPIRFVRDGVEFVPRVTYQNEDGAVLHLDQHKDPKRICQ